MIEQNLYIFSYTPHNYSPQMIPTYFNRTNTHRNILCILHRQLLMSVHPSQPQKGQESTLTSPLIFQEVQCICLPVRLFCSSQLSFYCNWMFSTITVIQYFHSAIIKALIKIPSIISFPDWFHKTNHNALFLLVVFPNRYLDKLLEWRCVWVLVSWREGVGAMRGLRVLFSAEIYFFISLKLFGMIQSNQQLQTRNILNANQFNCVRKIGKGGFGHVLLATKATSSSCFYAIKCLSKKKMIKDPQLKKGLAQEVNTMASLQHTNIVKLFKTFEEGDWYFLVMEYCDMGNLYTIQSKLPAKVFALDEALNIFNQILKGVEVIHKNQIVHRDIKLENIFVRKAEKSGLLCKIGDFGLARFVEMTANSNCGTQNYMAPEILKSVPYDQAVDIWSLGVLLFYLLFGEFPFKGINILDDIMAKCKIGFRLNDHIKSKSFFRSRKEEVLLNDLFFKIFEIDVEKRITVSGMREHAAVRGKVGEDESTEEEVGNQTRAAIEWEINQMRFIQKIAKQVQICNFLSPFLLLAFKFYIHKVVLYLLNKDSIKNYRKDKDGHPKLLKVLADLETDLNLKLERMILQLRECKEVESIPNFEEGLNPKYQDFTKFKVAYRNTVGRVYEQVHKKYPQNSKERANLKLKVFLCHIINRVFVGGFNANIFPHLVGWVKKEKGKLSKFYDFRQIEEWIQNQTVENLTASQEIINKAFYR